MLRDYEPYGFVQIWLQLHKGTWLPVKYDRIAGGAHQLDYHEQHYLGIAEAVWRLRQHLIVHLREIDIVLGNRRCDSILEYAPAEIFRDECEQGLVIVELIYDIVDYPYELFLKGKIVYTFAQFAERGLEKLTGLVGHKLVADIILVLEIKIERALCYSCLVHDVGYGSLAEALRGKKFKSCFQQRIFLQLFIMVDLSHVYTPFLRMYGASPTVPLFFPLCSYVIIIIARKIGSVKAVKLTNRQLVQKRNLCRHTKI